MNKKILLGIAACFVFANQASAANKTHVTDTLGAGNSSMEISYAVQTLNLPGTYVFANGASINMDIKATQNQLAVAYYLGVTEQLDMGIFLPLSASSNVTSDYTNGARYNEVSRTEGQGDVSFGARLLLLDKHKDRMSWNIVGVISPATAPSDDPTTQVTTNGVVTTAGKNGQSGAGYMTTSLASTVSIPTGAGDVYLAFRYDNNGEKTSAGVVSKTGSFTTFTAGIENMVGDRITITPYAQYLTQAAGYHGTTVYAANSRYNFGLNVTNDISKNVSVTVGAAYNVRGDLPVTYAGGDKLNFSGNGYTFTASTMLFF